MAVRLWSKRNLEFGNYALSLQHGRQGYCKDYESSIRVD